MARKKEREIIRQKSANYVEAYANHVDMRNSFADFHLIFGRILEGTPEKLVVEHELGVVMSPQQTKEFLRVLNAQFAQYEKQNGPVPTPPRLPQAVTSKLKPK